MTINVLYNWIGPRGPMDNTEIPTVLGYAAVAEGSNTTSRRFWCEGLWTLLFKHDAEFKIMPSVTMQDEEVFIYPVQLGWRVMFENYFCQREGVLEYSHTPFNVINSIRHRNGYILIDLAAESFIGDYHLAALHSYFKYNQIPLYKVIYLTGAMNVDDIYNEYCQKNGIPDTKEDRLSIISYPSSLAALVRLKTDPSNAHQYYEPVFDVEKIPEKLFLTWNRRLHLHRIALVAILERYNALSNSYVSLQAIDPEYSNKTTAQQIDRHFFRGVLNIDDGIIDSMLAKLPLNIDNVTDINQMCGDPQSEASKFYSNSLVSIVTETHFSNSIVTLTEKSFKAPKEKHPFIMVGAKGALAALQRLGFKTFADCWDESYDDMADPWARMRAVGLLIEKIAAWDDQQKLQFRRVIADRLEHNYKLVSTRSEMNPDAMTRRRLKEIINQGK